MLAERHKQDSLAKQKAGKGHWKPDLASDSEEKRKSGSVGLRPFCRIANMCGLTDPRSTQYKPELGSRGDERAARKDEEDRRGDQQGRHKHA